jgi:hypothetical protein
MKKFKISKILCKIGIHQKHTFEKEHEVNWLTMWHTITKCKKCNKIF